jgi:fructose/tagatose bisphosphate aldolase
MSLVLNRTHVLEVFAEARERKWVIPSFNAENLTTMEAILEAVYKYGKLKSINNLPIIIGITNNYASRPQSVFYTNTKKWYIGLKLFLRDLEVLTASDSPYKNLRVMIHLDHIHWEEDIKLLEWDMRQFSSIMYDASTLPFDKNIENTAAFVEKNINTIVIEGACDEISEASGEGSNNLTTPDQAKRYFQETGVDIIVANLGTEHRAAASTLEYNGHLARAISKKIGPHLCLHGASSLAKEQISHLFKDGICKVNIWTALERDSSPILFQKMIENAAKIVGPKKAKEMLTEGLIGKTADSKSSLSIKFYTTTFRQETVFKKMKEIVHVYLSLLYV